MKKSKFIILAIVLWQCMFTSSKIYANDLTPEDEQYILDKITQWCRDIGCDGLYDAEFHSLSCDFNAEDCSLKLTFLSYYHYHKDHFIDGPVPIECPLWVELTEAFFSDKDLFIKQNALMDQVHECMYDQRMLLDNE